MAILLLLLILLPIFFIFLVVKQHRPRQNPRRPPGPKGLPLIGNLHQLDVSNPHIWLKNHSDKYSPITFFKLCRLPVIVLSSAQVAKIMKENDVAFAGRPHSSAWSRLSYDQSDIIGSPYTDYWRHMRKLVVHHLLSPQKIRSFRPVREEEVSRMIYEISKKAESEQLVDVEEMALSFTCNLLCRVAFGKKFDRGTSSWRLLDPILKQFLASVTETFLVDNLLYGWINIIFGGARRVERVFEEMDKFYEEIIEKHRSRRKVDSEEKNILDLLIEFKEDESAPVKIDWKHIKALLMNSDYIVESGGSRNFEPRRAEEEEIEEERKKRKGEEMGDSLKSLENRTLDSKREIDIVEHHWPSKDVLLQTFTIVIDSASISFKIYLCSSKGLYICSSGFARRLWKYNLKY